MREDTMGEGPVPQLLSGEEALTPQSLACQSSTCPQVPGAPETGTPRVLTTFYGFFHGRIHREDVLFHQLQWPWPESDLFIEIISKAGSFQLHLSSWNGPLCGGD